MKAIWGLPFFLLFLATVTYAEYSDEVVSSYTVSGDSDNNFSYHYDLPTFINTNEKVIVVDPKLHAWGAYAPDGRLIRSGRASAGAKWCKDTEQSCKTPTGVFHIYMLGDENCYSTKYPVDEGGAPMPYCMYFGSSEALHGSNEVEDDNISHGCVRLRMSDAKWLRYNFADKGTKVIIKSY